MGRIKYLHGEGIICRCQEELQSKSFKPQMDGRKKIEEGYPRRREERRRKFNSQAFKMPYNLVFSVHSLLKPFQYSTFPKIPLAAPSVSALASQQSLAYLPGGPEISRPLSAVILMLGCPEQVLLCKILNNTQQYF